MRKLIHKVDDTSKLSQPICGAYLFTGDTNHFTSTNDKAVTCPKCLQAIEEREHIKDGRLVF